MSDGVTAAARSRVVVTELGGCMETRDHLVETSYEQGTDTQEVTSLP